MTAPRRPRTTVVVDAARNWWELFLLAFAIRTGVRAITDPPVVMPYLHQYLPGFVTVAWGVFLVIGGVIAGAGVLMRLGVLSLLIERAGLLMLAGICLSYPAALVLAFGTAALDRAVIVLLFGLLVLHRAVQITHTVGYGTMGSHRRHLAKQTP